MASASKPYDSIVYLAPKCAVWDDIVIQFVTRVTAEQGRHYAHWAGERLRHIIETAAGMVALTRDGKLLGMMLFEMVGPSAEMGFPWIAQASGNAEVASALATATLLVVREQHPAVQFLRAERQIIPGQADPAGLLAAGFLCGWRQRMLLQLADWDGKVRAPAGYTLLPWDIRYLDAVAEVVHRANEGTADAQLYAPFFGDSPAHCRKGVLAILAGKYGPVHALASQVAVANDQVIGVSIIVDEDGGMASVVEISVEPEKQHQGIGRALLTQGLGELRRHGFERVELAVTKSNLSACRFYQSLDFQPAGDFPVCYFPG